MRRYCDADYAEVASWYAARGLRAPCRELFPTYGLIEPRVGAGFLYRTDAALVLIEGLIVNPAAPGRARSRALNAILKRLIAHGGEDSVVIGLPQTSGMARRAARHGMRSIGRYDLMIAKEN